MRRQRTKDTEPEIALRRALRARGLPGYRKHHRVLPSLRRTVDIAFVGPKVAVDVRGCFWHGCADHARRGHSHVEWWEEKLRTNIERDLETEKLMTEVGWQVVVVWEHEDPELAAERVETAVRQRSDKSRTQRKCRR